MNTYEDVMSPDVALRCVNKELFGEVYDAEIILHPSVADTMKCEYGIVSNADCYTILDSHGQTFLLGLGKGNVVVSIDILEVSKPEALRVDYTATIQEFRKQGRVFRRILPVVSTITLILFGLGVYICLKLGGVL